MPTIRALRAALAQAVVATALTIAAPAGAEPAKRLFGAEAAPTAEQANPYGSYARGCIAGAVALAETGPSWQAMRLSRNRNWGHPDLIAFVERLGVEAQALGWPRLYVGDLSQPRGGPMLTGHRSHQIGLDADIWMRRPGQRPLSRSERERIGSYSVVAGNRRQVNGNWTPEHHALLKSAARDPAVARIFVNAAIKAELCRAEPAGDRAWLNRIRPWWGHDAHFHIRLSCPASATGCVEQAPPPPGDGCDETLAWWLSDEALNPKPKPGAKKAKPRGPLSLADLPAACQRLVGR
ncbi:MAG: penicillin-insensitive murein endopeptidase [Pseudomonadota bacterium]